MMWQAHQWMEGGQKQVWARCGICDDGWMNEIQCCFYWARWSRRLTNSCICNTIWHLGLIKCINGNTCHSEFQMLKDPHHCQIKNGAEWKPETEGNIIAQLIGLNKPNHTHNALSTTKYFSIHFLKNTFPIAAPIPQLADQAPLLIFVDVFGHQQPPTPPTAITITT